MDNLGTLLEKSQNRMTQWTSEFKHIVNGVTSDEEPRILQKKIENLKESINMAVTEKEKVSEDNKQQAQNLQSELEILTDKISAKEKIITLLEEELAHIIKQEQSVKEASSGPDPSAVEEKKKRYEEEEARYRKRLALEILKVKGGWLQFIFTQIDAKNPSLPFMFSLTLDENRKYKVSDVQPPLCNMEELLSQLNSSNDLHKFVHTVRRQFQLQAASSSAE